MKAAEFFKKIDKLVLLAREQEYDIVGVRFEDALRANGDICNNSRHNVEREDERDFPEYGTEEYECMVELKGTSAWIITAEYETAAEISALKYFNRSDADVERLTVANHCYVVAGDYENTPSDADDGEVVIEDAKVIGCVF